MHTKCSKQGRIPSSCHSIRRVVQSNLALSFGRRYAGECALSVRRRQRKISQFSKKTCFRLPAQILRHLLSHAAQKGLYDFYHGSLQNKSIAPHHLPPPTSAQEIACGIGRGAFQNMIGATRTPTNMSNHTMASAHTHVMKGSVGRAAQDSTLPMRTTISRRKMQRITSVGGRKHSSMTGIPEYDEE